MPDFDNYIGGRWTTSPRTLPNINPSNTTDIIGCYAQATAGQALQAIDAATKAFSKWSQVGIQQRSDMLEAIGGEILSRKDELGRLLAREEGKILPEALAEVIRAGRTFKFFAGEALRTRGESRPSLRAGVNVEIRREPVGVVGIITPWNFPIAIPAWKIAPALAYGNCVIFKPASAVPGSAWELAAIIARAGLPEGVFNLVMGSGGVVGTALLNDPRVHGISFTGSITTGREVANACSSRGAKFQLEMGGKNPLVILNDADLEIAVECAVDGAFFATGQRCTASSRLIVECGIHDAFVEAIIDATANLRVGDALSEGTHLGPVIDQSQLDQNLNYLAIGKDEGATLATGGQQLSLDKPGFYLSPALFVDTHNRMRINQEEIFGPIATIIKAADMDEAIDIANDTPYGLSSGICTSSLASITRFKAQAGAGMVMVNLPTAGVDYHVPFGGTKASSFGPREQGEYAQEFYTTVKTAYIRS